MGLLPRGRRRLDRLCGFRPTVPASGSTCAWRLSKPARPTSLILTWKGSDRVFRPASGRAAGRPARPPTGRGGSSRPSFPRRKRDLFIGRQVAFGLVVGDVAIEAEQEIVGAAERPQAAEILGQRPVVKVPLESRHPAKLAAGGEPRIDNATGQRGGQNAARKQFGPVAVVRIGSVARAGRARRTLGRLDPRRKPQSSDPPSGGRTRGVCLPPPWRSRRRLRASWSRRRLPLAKGRPGSKPSPQPLLWSIWRPACAVGFRNSGDQAAAAPAGRQHFGDPVQRRKPPAQPPASARRSSRRACAATTIFADRGAVVVNVPSWRTKFASQ